MTRIEKPIDWEEFIMEGIKDLTLLDRHQRADKFFSISYELPTPLKSISAQDRDFKEGRNFLKHSFKYFTDKYKEEYAFHSPTFSYGLKTSDLHLLFSMRLKEDIHEPA